MRSSAWACRTLRTAASATAWEGGEGGRWAGPEPELTRASRHRALARLGGWVRGEWGPPPRKHKGTVLGPVFWGPQLTHNKDLQQLCHEPQCVPAHCEEEGASCWTSGLPSPAFLTPDLSPPHAGGALCRPRGLGTPRSCSAGSRVPGSSWCGPARHLVSRTFGLAVREVRAQQLAHQVLGGGDEGGQWGQRPITSPTCHRPPWPLSSGSWRGRLLGQGTGQ